MPAVRPPKVQGRERSHPSVRRVRSVPVPDGPVRHRRTQDPAPSGFLMECT